MGAQAILANDCKFFAEVNEILNLIMEFYKLFVSFKLLRILSNVCDIFFRWEGGRGEDTLGIVRGVPVKLVIAHK